MPILKLSNCRSKVNNEFLLKLMNLRLTAFGIILKGGFFVNSIISYRGDEYEN